MAGREGADLAGEFAVEHTTSNQFDMEWPRGSGIIRSFPEVDRSAWFDLDEARERLLSGQVPFLDRLVEALRESDAIET